MDTAVDFLLQTVMGILIARAMGPSKLGAWGYVLWISSMAVQVGNFGVPAALLKYLSDLLGQRRFEEIAALIRGTALFQGLVSVGITGVGLIWAGYFLPAEQRTFGILAVLSIIPSGVLGIATAMNSAMENQRYNAIPSIAGIVTQVSVSVATLLLDWGLVGLASALLLGRILDTSVRWGFALRSFPAHLRRLGWKPQQISGHSPLSVELRRELVRYCGHATMLLVLRLVVWNRSEVFFLKQFCGLEQLAFYSVAAGFALIPTSLATPFINAAMPSIFAERGRDSDSARRFTASCWRYLALIVFPTSVGLLVLSRPLIRVLYGPQYYASAPVLMCAMALALIPPLIMPATSFVAAENGQSFLVRWNVIAAVVVLGLDWLLISQLCSTGAALANGIGQTVTTLGVWLIAARRFKLRLPFRFAGRLLLACLFMGGAAVVVLLLSSDLVAIIVGPPVGAAAFIVGMRLARVLDAEDIERLSILERVFPGKTRAGYIKLLAWMGRTPLGAQA